MTMSYWNESVEKMNRRDLEILKMKKISWTLNYAKKNSPFYKRLFRENEIDIDKIKTEDDIVKKIPIVDKTTLIENQRPSSKTFNFLSSPQRFLHTRHYTSGTKGIPKVCFRTFDDWDVSAECCARGYYAADISEKDLVLDLMPFGINVSGLASLNGFKNIGAQVLTAGLSKYPKRTDLIETHKPTAVMGAPSTIDRLSRELEIDGIKPNSTSIEKIILAGEGSTKEKRERIADSFGAEVYQFYASNEGDVMAYSCGEEGLHVNEDKNLLNAVDLETMEILGENEEGADLLTTLVEPGIHRGMVLINYHHGDSISLLSEEKCSCGRTLKRINEEIKRVDDMIEIGYIKLNPSDIESVVYDPRYKKYLTGEYEIEKKFDETERLYDVTVRAEKKIKDVPKNIEEELKKKILEKNYALSVATAPGAIVNFEVRTVDKDEMKVFKKSGKPKRIYDS